MSEKDLDQYNEIGRQILIDRARRGGLKSFTLLTKADYQVNWHHELTCKYLNRFIRKEIKRLMIFEPPRHGKSELTSRRLPALLHGLFPDDEILAMSYNAELASDMTIDTQRIMDRPDYREIFPLSRITPEGSISKYARKANEHELIPVETRKGYWAYPQGAYRSAGVGGSFTGRGGKWVLIDDPIKNRADADSRAFREELWKMYTSSIRTRLEGDAAILITLTRWHDDDLVGRLLKLARQNPSADQWTILNLPAIRETEHHEEDPRKLNEGLWLRKFDQKWYTSTKASIGSRDWAALYQQRPSVEGGNIIQSHWFKWYGALPEKFHQVLISCDFAVKDKAMSDFNAIQVWGRVGADKYLIYRLKGRWPFPVTCQKLVEICKRFPNAHKKLVESKANGPAIVQTLKKYVPGLVEVEPMGDKLARLNAVAPDFESGNIHIPVAALDPTIDEYVAEMCDFPTGVNDDEVDATTQCLIEMRKAGAIHMPIGGHGSGHIFS
jgi:predicted phage terminase large subunit-like protein